MGQGNRTLEIASVKRAFSQKEGGAGTTPSRSIDIVNNKDPDGTKRGARKAR